MFSLENKTIVVTGGTGSLGQTLVRRILAAELGKPKKVIVFSRDEAKQHNMRLSYLCRRAGTDELIYRNFQQVLEFRLGDIRSYADVASVLRGADIVFNAAAVKQVPACEYFPGQALLTNCRGAANIVRAVEEGGCSVETVVGISTDKACKPVNVMGMTKALQERIFISANILNTGTRFLCVRYGNVLASRGSVVPLFHEQIRHGGPLTVTHPEMTRFLLSLDDAVDTIFAALHQGRRGETYIPAAPSAAVMDIARALAAGREIDIEISGIRPGEKLHEILVSEEEARRCVKRGDYYVIRPILPELAVETPDPPAPLAEGEFSSAGSLIDQEGVSALLARHGLLEPDSGEIPNER